MKNTVLLIGRITKDIELRRTKSGNDVVQFNLAVNRDFKNTEGVYETDFINITTYNQTAKYLNEYATKGDLVGIKGRIQTGSYEKDGETKYTQTIIADKVSLLAYSKKDEQKEEPVKEEINNFEDYGNSIAMEDISTDDLPF